MNPTMAFLLLASVLLISVGIAKLVAVFFDRREADAQRAINAASFAARAAAEVRRG